MPIALSQVVRSFLSGVSPMDPVLYALSATGMIPLAMTASALLAARGCNGTERGVTCGVRRWKEHGSRLMTPLVAETSRYPRRADGT